MSLSGEALIDGSGAACSGSEETGGGLIAGGVVSGGASSLGSDSMSASVGGLATDSADVAFFAGGATGTELTSFMRLRMMLMVHKIRLHPGPASITAMAQAGITPTALGREGNNVSVLGPTTDFSAMMQLFFTCPRRQEAISLSSLTLYTIFHPFIQAKAQKPRLSSAPSSGSLSSAPPPLPLISPPSSRERRALVSSRTEGRGRKPSARRHPANRT